MVLFMSCILHGGLEIGAFFEFFHWASERFKFLFKELHSNLSLQTPLQYKRLKYTG